MKLSRNSIFYIIITLILGGLIWIILEQGKMLESIDGINIILAPQQSISFAFSHSQFFNDFTKSMSGPVAILLLQILSILVTARLLGWLMVKIGQPTVIGEIIAGIILGPSLLGYIAPEFSSFLFPAESLNGLHFLSQLGLILFMFIVGMELDIKQVKKQFRNAVVVSNSSIILPFFFGVLLAYYLYIEYGNGSTFTAFALFMGIAMSITAFPILARIVLEKNLVKTPVGSMALSIAAANDISAWFILAAVIAIVKAGSLSGAFFTIAFSLVFVIIMLVGVRSFLNILAKNYFSRETVNKPIVALIFVILFLSAWTAEVIGIHALFGAFIAGVSVPSSSRFRHLLAQKIEDVSLVLLLPIFFVFTGLRTQIGVMQEPHLWGIFGIVLAAAVTGKFLGSALSARWVGISWKDSLILGTLMNTRGLMELIVLNIGYDLGILSTEIFSILVLMALTTTFMTGPFLNMINYFFSKNSVNGAKSNNYGTYSILISFGEPKSGSRLLELAYMLFDSNSDKETKYTAMHFTPSSDITLEDANTFEAEGFKHILKKAKNLNIQIDTHFKTTNDVSREITQYANNGQFDLMLAGSSRPLFSSKLTGGKVRFMFDEIDTNVGILIDRGFKNIEKIIFIIDEYPDPLLSFRKSGLLQNENYNITIVDLNNIFKDDDTMWGIRNKENADRISRAKYISLDEAFISDFDLVITGINHFNKAKQQNADWLTFSPSILIVS